MAVQLSIDYGVSWPSKVALNNDSAAYSDLLAINGNSVALLYETGSSSVYQNIAFQKLVFSR